MRADQFGNTAIKRAQRVCYLCGHSFGAPVPKGTPFRRQINHSAKSTADHVFPKCAGYTFARNKLFAHLNCNERKGSRMPRPCEVLFLAIVHEIIEAKAAA